MCDFELAIINALKETFAIEIIRLCLFHLCQSVYRRIQAEGLEQKYKDEVDNSIREAARCMCALAFVPPQDVADIFDKFYDQVPEDFLPIADYFEINYIRGKRAVGRRRAVVVRCHPSLWNQYNAVLQRTAHTNNASEGWHNKFQIVVGKSHPSM